MKKIEKNATSTKERDGSFVDVGKEPFNVRLKSLLGGRSVYQASKDWGVNLSTLKNYFSRQGSTPRHEVLARISKCEDVSVEWLLYGNSIKSRKTALIESEFKATIETTNLSPSALKLASILDVLDDEDIDNLTKMLTRKGAETILYLLNEDNINLLRLDTVVKEKILGKQPKTPQEADLNAQKARECDSVDERELAAGSLVSDSRKRVS